MRGTERSTDAGVRPSPSISATVYPRGYQMRGNDGNIWEIIVDSRGTHRWKKTIGAKTYDARTAESKIKEAKSDAQEVLSEVEKKTKKQIEGADILIKDDPSAKDQIIPVLERKLKELERQYDLTGDFGDEKYGKAALMIRKYLRTMMKHGGMTKARRDMFQSAYDSGLNRSGSREYLEKRLKEI